MGYGTGTGFSPSDPPLAQLSGETSGGWRDKLGAFGAGLINAGDEDFKKGLAGAGDMAAFYKRRDERKQRQVTDMSTDTEHQEYLQQLEKNRTKFQTRQPEGGY